MVEDALPGDMSPEAERVANHVHAGTAPPARSHRPTAVPVQQAAGPAGGASIVEPRHNGRLIADRRGRLLSPARSHCTPRGEEEGSPRRWFSKADAGSLPRFHDGSASGGQQRAGPGSGGAGCAKTISVRRGDHQSASPAASHFSNPAPGRRSPRCATHRTTPPRSSGTLATFCWGTARTVGPGPVPGERPAA